MRHLATGLVTAVAVTCLAVPAASSAKSVKPDCSSKLVKSANKHRAVVVKKEGKRAPGRDIVKYGITDGKRASCAQVREYRDTLVRLHTPAPAPVATASATSASTSAPAPTSNGGVGNATVQCESGGDYSINTGNGYYGGYQFDSQTWDAYGDPAYGEANEAPPAVQDQAAANVPYDAWPNC